MKRASSILLSLCATVLTVVAAAPFAPGPGMPAPGQGVPPAPPAPQRFVRSSVDYFRELLNMTPEQQRAALAGKPVSYRESMQRKLAEYAGLSKEERELRLCSTELRWYLKPLMERAPADRAERLERVPANLRAAIEIRLQQWDKLPADMQKEVLASENVAAYFSRPAVQREQLLSAISNKVEREKTEKAIREWEKKSVTERERISANFKMFFEFSETDQQKTLNLMPEQERQVMEQTLREFAALPADKRQQCIASFQKFATMSPKQRDQFLKNAEQWNKMSAAEREQWRQVVVQLPPLPEGFYEVSATMADLPPLPPGLSVLPPGPVIARP